MKRVFKIIFLTAAMLVLTSFSANAESNSRGEYIVSSVDGGYLLSGYGSSGLSPVMRSEKMSEIIEYLNTKRESVGLVFNQISLNEDLVFKSCDISVSGALTLNENHSVEIIGGKFSAESFSLAFDKGALIIKDGDCIFRNSRIASNATAVIMNYSAGARADFQSGEIVGDSKHASIVVEMGQALLRTASVYNASGPAIFNSSTFTLLPNADINGEGYDISTTTPITLSSAEGEFYSKIKVKFEKTFEKGTINCVFYSASSESVSCLSLFDVNGTEQPLTFFESFEGIREKNFGAVYLPYKVTFYYEDTLVATQEILGDTRLTEEIAPIKSGYDFVGWGTATEGEEVYDFAKKVKSDFSLYAKYKLTPPKITLASLEFTYDGKEHEFGITGLSHELSESAIINYEWYFNGRFVSDSGPKIRLSRVSQGGEYFCAVSFTYGTDTVRVTTPPVSVKINKAVIELPNVAQKNYNGEYQSSDISDTSYYTVSDVSALYVGVYPVVLTVRDSENCEFASGGVTATVDFRIVKARNFWIDELRAFDVYQGMQLSHTALSRFGEVLYIYSDKYDGNYVDTPPTIPGSYFCKAYVSGCENYCELYSEPRNFVIVEEVINGISIFSMPKICEYTAFDSFIADGLSVSVTHNSGRVEVVNAEKLTFSYQSAENFRYGDSGVTATYLGASVTVPLTVKQARYDLSAIAFENESFMYNGSYQSISFKGVLPIGKDGIALSASVVGGGINAGVYTVALVFSTASKNYESPKAIERTLTVFPYRSAVVFYDLTFVYDGKEKCPSAYYQDVFGRKVEVAVDGARSLAGEYIAVACPNDSNYLLDGSSITYSILKANYDFSGVTWIGSKYVYDGFEKSVYIDGLPDGVHVVGYSDNSASCAGAYTARATFSYDERNYNPPPEIRHEWKIDKAEYDTSLFKFTDAEYVYDGSMHYPELVGDMPVGIDGERLEYKFSTGVLHVSEGRVEVEVLFFTESKNYAVPESVSVFVEITPLGIRVEWENLSFVYDTLSHAPNAYSESCRVTVLGAMTDSGSYTATAITLNSDYYIINDTVAYSIEKAENFWTQRIEVGDIYEGRLPAPHAECISGEVTYVYYSVKGDILTEIPKEPGTYYVKAFSDGSRNYRPIESEQVRFEIVEVVPVSIYVSLIKERYKAFEVLSDKDIEVTVKNNDGSTFRAPHDEILIFYESADSFRYLDSYLTVSFCGYRERVEVFVEKADYDMSTIKWNEDTFVFDGKEKRVYLTGLPSGLIAREYRGADGTLAGEYKAEAFFDYDSHNYNPPESVSCIWTIQKQSVPIPKLDKLEYNGKEQRPIISDSDLFSVSYSNAKDAGRYPIIIKLHDSENYEFSGFEDTAVIYYEITPRVITVKLFDVDKYLLSEVDKPDYELVSGSINDGDELTLSFIYSENEVYCESENENYSVRVIPGRIIRHNTLSEKAFFFLFIALALSVLTVLVTLFLVYKRKDIAHYVYVLKCRLSPTEAQSEITCKPAATYEELGEIARMEQTLSVDAERADSLISDALAKNLLRKEDIRIESDGRKKRIINVDTLSENFASDERVDVNVLKAKKLIPADTAYIKVLARGVIDKPLKVYANDFSLSAVKMIALSGGEAIKVVTVRKSGGERK